MSSQHSEHGFLPRRQFLKLVVGATAAVGMPLLAACGGSQPAPAATAQPAAAGTSAPASASPSAPTAAPAAAATTAPGVATPAPASNPVGAVTPAGSAQSVQIVNTIPAKFSEAPALADLVKAGKLPPVEQRLPESPIVYKPVNKIGKYGGTWHSTFSGPADSQHIERLMHDHFIYWDYTVHNVVPNIAQSWDVLDGGKTFTFHLRKGLKWSDGQPFTADDIMFWYEDLYLNDQLNPSKAAFMAINGKQGTVSKVDDTTVQFKFDSPYFLFLELIASLGVAGQLTNGKNAMGLYSPKHYMQQFHPKYVGQDKVDQMAKAAKYDSWVLFFKYKNDPESNIDCPMMTPWKITSPVTSQLLSLERNPYYFAVDTEGNQLPYIDKIQMPLNSNLEVVNTQAAAGDYDFVVRYLSLSKVPVLKQNEQKGNYTIRLFQWPNGADAGFFVNQNYDKDAEVRKWLTNKDFRIALSLGFDRDQLNQVFWLGLGDPGSAAPGPQSPFYLGPESRKLHSTFDAKTANETLDKLGLDKKGSDGFRLRTDGQGTLVVEIATVPNGTVDLTGIGQMVSDHWAKNIGIKAVVKQIERGLMATQLAANQLQIRVWQNDGSENPFTYPDHTIAYNTGSGFGPLYGLWYQSGGKQGVKPDGDILKQLQLFDQGKGVPDEQRVDLGKQILQLYVDNVWVIGTCGVSPANQGICLVKNTVDNVPQQIPMSTPGQSPGNAHPEQFFFTNI